MQIDFSSRHRSRSHRAPSLPQAILFAVVFFGAGLFMARHGFLELRDAVESYGWPEVQGRIESSEVASHSGSEGTMYTASVRYSYQLDGVEHRSSAISFGEYSSGSSGAARRIVKRYPPGATVSVHVDPSAPGVSVLEPGIKMANLLVFGTGLLFMAVSPVVVMVAIRGRPYGTPPPSVNIGLEPPA